MKVLSWWRSRACGCPVLNSSDSSMAFRSVSSSGSAATRHRLSEALHQLRRQRRPRVEEHYARCRGGVVGGVESSQVGAGRVPEHLDASQAQAPTQPLEVLDPTAERNALHVAHPSVPAAALVVVDELDLVAPWIERPHVGAAQPDGTVQDEERCALADDGAGDLDVTHGNGLADGLHEDLLGRDRHSVRLQTVGLAPGFKVKSVTLSRSARFIVDGCASPSSPTGWVYRFRRSATTSGSASWPSPHAPALATASTTTTPPSRLLFVTRARKLGLPCEQIVELLPIWDGTNCTSTHDEVARLIAKKKVEIADRIEELTTFSAQLDRIPGPLTGSIARGDSIAARSAGRRSRAIR